MTDYLARLFYLGDQYYGSQYQLGFDTVQGRLIESLNKWSGETHSPQTVQLSGRTDRGVHSIGQLVMVTTSKHFDIDIINKQLPEDIQLWAATKAPINFKPRYSVLMRHYRYYLTESWENTSSTLVRKTINTLIGSNDFSNISKPDSGRNTSTTILNISLQKTNDAHYLDIFGTRFLWKLVRKIVTLLTDVGIGKIKPDEVNEILLGRTKIPSGIRPAPPENLILVETVTPVKLKISKYAIRRITALLNDRLEYHRHTTKTLENVINYFSEPGTTFRLSTIRRTHSESEDSP